MPLAPGTRLGPYEILGALGAGGMGEVYRARDTKLGREVALKVLPDAFARDPERLARFQQEARLLAALNHPHIAAIYGLEEAACDEPSGRGASGARMAPVRFLVLELVPGETLAEQIARGALPPGEALAVCRQIAEGLEAAHDKGIIHRDLKPANIKITPEGQVKVLDFGLAKAFAPHEVSPGSAPADPMQSPTLTGAGTQAGVILGTAAYMSPEQARGKPVDKRTDIWAFGCVLYEALTGRLAFQGETISDTLAAILKTEPDWEALPSDAGSRLRELLKRCLRKDPGQRLRDIGDARQEIEAAIVAGLDRAGAESGAGVSRAGGAARREKIAWGLLVAALAALAAVTLVLARVWSRGAPPEARPLRLSIVHTEGNEVGAPAISPDGRRIAYRARRADGMPMLWVRDLDKYEARALAGTEDASFPFWSPDSGQLGFTAGKVVKRIPADGGPVQVIIKGGGGGGAWAPDGTIIFSGLQPQLWQVNASGGEVTPATTLPGKDWQHFWPSFLPDGRRFLFTAKVWTRAAESGDQGIYLGSLDSTEVRRLLPDLSSAVYAPPGYIVFSRNGTLSAAPFDLETGRLTGEPRGLEEIIALDNASYLAAVSAAADGSLAVRPPPACAIGRYDGGAGCDYELRLVDRDNKVLSTGVPRRYTYLMALAPGGRRLATGIADPTMGTQDLWLIDLQTGSQSPLVTTRGFSGAPVWSPDGARLAYAYQPPGQVDDVYIKDLRTGQVTPVIESAAVGEHPVAWSHDGAHLLVDSFDELELRSWSFASRALTPFVKGRTTEAAFSPDDRYVAYSSIESGRYEVYVTTFPDRRQTWPLTTEGGRVLSWRTDGREILVATLAGHIAAYPVSTGGRFTAGQPTILIRDVGGQAPFSSATPDHSRILIRVNPDAAKDKGEMRLLFNWANALTRPTAEGKN